jgi:ATP-dependent helicase/nuclease subunit A
MITPEQAKAVSSRQIYRFFQAFGDQIASADAIFREFKFSVLTPASAHFDVSEGEQILLQGVVDCCIEKDGDLTIIDFKTDYVNQNEENDHAQRYRGQLEAYAYAMEQVTGKTVKEKLVFFLSVGRGVSL